MDTDHFQMRMRSRGIQECLVQALRNYADRLIHLRGRCTAEIISKRRLIDLEKDGTLSASMAERLGGLVLVQAPNGSSVTVLRLHGSKARYYTRDHRKSRHSRRRARTGARASLRARTPLAFPNPSLGDDK